MDLLSSPLSAAPSMGSASVKGRDYNELPLLMDLMEDKLQPKELQPMPSLMDLDISGLNESDATTAETPRSESVTSVAGPFVKSVSERGGIPVAGVVSKTPSATDCVVGYKMDLDGDNGEFEETAEAQTERLDRCYQHLQELEQGMVGPKLFKTEVVRLKGPAKLAEPLWTVEGVQGLVPAYAVMENMLLEALSRRRSIPLLEWLKVAYSDLEPLSRHRVKISEACHFVQGLFKTSLLFLDMAMSILYCGNFMPTL